MLVFYCIVLLRILCFSNSLFVLSCETNWLSFHTWYIKRHNHWNLLSLEKDLATTMRRVCRVVPVEVLREEYAHLHVFVNASQDGLARIASHMLDSIQSFMNEKIASRIWNLQDHILTNRESGRALLLLDWRYCWHQPLEEEWTGGDLFQMNSYNEMDTIENEAARQ